MYVHLYAAAKIPKAPRTSRSILCVRTRMRIPCNCFFTTHKTTIVQFKPDRAQAIFLYFFLQIHHAYTHSMSAFPRGISSSCRARIIGYEVRRIFEFSYVAVSCNYNITVKVYFVIDTRAREGACHRRLFYPSFFAKTSGKKLHSEISTNNAIEIIIFIYVLASISEFP